MKNKCTNRKDRIAFGIVGCGMIANVHADAIRSIPDAELVGVTDNNIASAEKLAKKYSVKAYSDYDQMLHDPMIDVVCVCTPSDFHDSNAISALENGKHVVLEKPMTLTTKRAEKLIEICEKTELCLTVISQLRFSEDIIKIKKLLMENAFGKVSLASLSMKYYRSTDYYSSWKGTKKFDGGGALMNQGIHGIDLLQYLLGPVKEVSGRISTLCHNIEVEDTAVATIEFDSGALAIIEASTATYPGFARKLEIHGNQGYVILKEDRIESMMINGTEIPTECKYVAESGNGTANDPSKLTSDGHKRQIENLISAIRGEASLLVDCHEGKKAIEIIEKIYSS